MRHERHFMHERRRGPKGPMRMRIRCDNCGDRPLAPRFGMRGGRIPRVLVDEKEDVLTLFISLPGIDKSSLKVRANSEFIIYSANLKEELAKASGTEKVDGRIPLMDEVNTESIKARYEDGILYLTLDKIETGETIEVE